MRRLVAEHMPPAEREKEPQGTAAALLRGWLRDEATDEPAQRQKAQKELDKFKRSLNANRAVTGEQPPYPQC